jgi:hypothetical protein
VATVVLLSQKARSSVTEVSELRGQIINVVLDALEVLTGENVVVIVSTDDEGILTPWVPWGDERYLLDVLNTWVDNKVWNAPKSL